MEMKQKLTDKLFYAYTNQKRWCTAGLYGSVQHTARQLGLYKKHFLKIMSPQKHTVKTLEVFKEEGWRK